MEKVEQQIPTTYDPKNIENKWYEYWLKNEFFKADNESDKEPYSIVIPPPNVTGMLHIGHAFDFTLQDIMARMKRMQGYNTLWLPGTDHAGIATQAKVEEKLREEGTSRYDLGREKFLEKSWEWKEKYSTTIHDQWAKLGLSLDYSRERFTLDEGLSIAVKNVFVSLYEKGLIYRGKYIINWDPEARTALSDIEVEYKDVQGFFYHMRYPLKDNSGFINIATTRPETMLGDTAVAVHPKDERYKHLVGKTIILPITGREIPIIEDDYVDREFGSGAVKITPAHDPNDFEIGNRHNLPRILIMDEKGAMNENAGKYQGLDRFECRKQIVKDLQEQGVILKIEEHLHSVGHSQRNGVIVEPYLSTQWFVKMKPLADKAIEHQNSKDKVNFIPERFEKTYLNWIENIRDWCVSRQLWWGHRIPAWYCQDCNEIIVRTEEPNTCPKCGGKSLKQDEDVLDTWFSSGLWPFSTMGWPEQTMDFQKYYPTSLLITGYDIIFFWVARMIFTALDFTGVKPFKDVYIHGLIRDSDGRKMSKSLGNGIDPLVVIDQYGADALRFMLTTSAAAGQDLRFHFERVEAARNFANKIWNASRFTIMNLGDFTSSDIDIRGPLSTADEWILHRFNETVKDVTALLDQYDFGEAGKKLTHFIWDEFCDWYIELAKSPLYGDDEQAKNRSKSILTYLLDNILRLLHPYMPFITEEIWQHLPHEGDSIVVAKWPEYNESFHNPKAEKEMTLLMDVIRSVRNIRAEVNVPLSKKIKIIIIPTNHENQQILTTGNSYITRFCNPEDLLISLEINPPDKAISAVLTGAVVYLPLAGLIDIEQEINRLNKELETLNYEVERIQNKLSNKSFVEKAPEKVIEVEKEKEKDYMDKREKVLARIKDLKSEL
ncbi:MAG: valine--tRNA ligase [Vulcanibacillus sp.]